MTCDTRCGPSRCRPVPHAACPTSSSEPTHRSPRCAVGSSSSIPDAPPRRHDMTRRHMTSVGAIATVAALTLVTPVAAQSPSPAITGERVRLLTHGSFALSELALESFTALTGATLEVIPAQDAGSAVNQAILTKDDPIADALYGVDDTFLSRALAAGIFAPYQPAAPDG